MAYVQSSRKLYSFGLGGNGQLGIGQKENRLIPSLVSFDKNSPIQSDDHVVHFIASGGDQCFVSAVSFLVKISITHVYDIILHLFILSIAMLLSFKALFNRGAHTFELAGCFCFL